MSDLLEVEQKYRVDSFDAVRRRLTDAEALEQVVERDTYFAHPVRDFAQTDEAFRLRSIESASGERHVLTYKGPRRKAAVKTRLEREVPLGGDRQTAEAMLVDLGFDPVAEVTKRREAFATVAEGLRVLVTLDDVERAGRFVEVEVVAEDAAAAEAAVLAVAERLCLTSVERLSYLAIVLTGGTDEASPG